ncbi:MAG: DUF4159 domain-containing protein [Alphaproteobacteria bacterium]|nr:MAG: DUF4159 domain-containing protein [Alphaproteobacteria bacterium]
MSGLVWTTPWLLWGLALLPGLIWWLRRHPPAPRPCDFPAMRLLLGLAVPITPRRRTPWWLLVLRGGLIGMLILGLAGPVRQSFAPVRTPLLLLIDNGWAVASSWNELRDRAVQAASRAQYSKADVYVLATAPDASGQSVRLMGPMPAAQAQRQIEALTPQPWPTSRTQAAQAMAAVPSAARAIWFSDGLASSGDPALRQALDALAGWEVTAPARRALLLRPVQTTERGLQWKITRAGPEATERAVTIRAIGVDETEIGRQTIILASGDNAGGDVMPLDPMALRQVARLELAQDIGAGGVSLMDTQARRGPITLRAAAGQEQPLLRGATYIRRALAPDYAVQEQAQIVDMQDSPPSLLILPEGGTPSADELRQLRGYVEKGGVLVRFAGGQAFDPLDPLLPAVLSRTPYQAQGALDWQGALTVKTPDADSPLAGLPVSSADKIAWVLRPEPSLPPSTQVWARLSDETPLVLAQPIGQGWLILVTARIDSLGGPFVLSESFVFLVRHMARLAHAPRLDLATPRKSFEEGSLPAHEVLNGLGRLAPPGEAVLALPAGEIWSPSPQHPPGFYGRPGDMQARNLGAVLPDLTPLSNARTWQRQEDGPQPLGGFLLALAGLMLVIDLALLARPRGKNRAGAWLALILMVAPGAAGATSVDLTRADLVLAYVMTGDSSTDRLSAQGLRGLARVLEQRTSLVHVAVTPVALDRDDLALYPLLYWPLSDAQAPLETDQARRLDAYWQQGGMTLFDLRGQDGAQLNRVLSALTLPALEPLPSDHVLTRSFYLMKEFPGRRPSTALWVSLGTERQDGIGALVVGDQDWASAWAVDSSGRPMVDLSPGGEAQREMAYRFGVNLVMMALTGRYKTDQVHLPYILRRLNREPMP